MKALVGWASWPTPAYQRASLACAGQEAYTTWVWHRLSTVCAAESYEAPRRLSSLVQAGRPALRRGLDYGSHGALGAGEAPVGTVAVDLIAAELGFSELAGDQHGSAGAIPFLGV